MASIEISFDYVDASLVHRIRISVQESGQSLEGERDEKVEKTGHKTAVINNEFHETGLY